MQPRFVCFLTPSKVGTVLFATLAIGCASDPPSDPFGGATANADASATESNSSGPGPDSGHDSGPTPGSDSVSSSDGGPDGNDDGPTSGNEEGQSSGTSGADDSADSGPTKFDLPNAGSATTGMDGGTETCMGGGGEGGDTCTEKAAPDSFEAAIQWSWEGPPLEAESDISPLVGNFTDDNEDGVIEPCGDIPDLVIVAAQNPGNSVAHIYVLHGAMGTLHFKIADPVDSTVTPAIGDIDGDGLLEIVTGVKAGLSANVVAFEHDGTKKWTSPDPWSTSELFISSIALADLDNDGDVEIMAGTGVYDHTGKRLWVAPTGLSGKGNATAASDLDGDGDLEVVLGHAAYHHDGAQHYLAVGVTAGYPQIANLDADPEPEVLVTNESGLTMLEHTGAVKYTALRPTGDPAGFTTWIRPATVHDFDGNGVSEFATSSANNYTVYNGDGTIVWKAAVSDKTGVAAGTAFDFLGDAKAEAMYADEVNFFIFNEMGVPYFAVPRSSRTAIEYPVVADIDNDGSAEIVVVSMGGQAIPKSAPTVQVIRDKQDRWVRARRIWNQHTYHVTNVYEDGRIPQFEAPNWETLNTFRTQAQIHSSGVCRPPPPE